MSRPAAGYSLLLPMRRRVLGAIAVCACALAAPVADAQVPGPQPPPPQPAPAPPPPAPPAQTGKATILLKGGVGTKKARYAVRGQRLRVTGTVKPFVAGQFVTVEVRRGRRVLLRRRTQVTQGKRGGRYSARITLRRRGNLKVRVRHRATPQQAAFRSRSRAVKVVRWGAGEGSSGVKVLLLQRTLRSLGFAIPVSGRYDGATSRGVLAYRKTNGMGGSGHASAAVYAKAFRGKGRYKLRHPRAGKHVEFDWSRQVLVLAAKGRAWRVYHASSGTPATPTVFGSYRFYRKQPGTNDKGMLHSNYFIRGYAIHGYPSVPNHPASHGCIRVPNPNAAQIDGWIRLGDPIFVYR
jgi:L,D-transpeptidase catalytic domain